LWWRGEVGIVVEEREARLVKDVRSRANTSRLESARSTKTTPLSIRRCRYIG
jgi:hypothetical protein